jgi:hypothetical protein
MIIQSFGQGPAKQFQPIIGMSFRWLFLGDLHSCIARVRFASQIHFAA